MTSAPDHRWVIPVTLTPPILADNTADADRLAAALNKALGTTTMHIGLTQLKALPEQLRQWNYQARAVLFKTENDRGSLVHLTAPDATEPLCGAAVDLGTTRVVLRIIDLETGEPLGERVFDNPQATVGPDVLARIHHVDAPDGLDRLNRLIVDGLNTELNALCRTCAIRCENIHLIAVAGNTAMTHLLLGLNPRWMIREPYIPVVNQPPVMEAAELGITAGPNARVLIFPNVGSYFGGDLIAGILFCDMDRREETAILVDVGTNAEVVLGNRNWMMACAGAAGPALEGGVTRMGTTAGPGVIDRIAIEERTMQFDVHTIGDQPPRGICGSGVIDLAAALFRSGMIDIRGKLLPERCGTRFTIKKDLAHLIVVPAAMSGTGEDLCISQADLDSLVRSKAAMYTILETITGSVGMTQAELETFFVAGTFGAYIDPQSAITIGMIPDLPLSSYQSLGNSSLGGAARILTDPSGFDRIKRIRDGITYMELNVNQDFMNRFSAAKFLPHTDTARFPSVRVPGNGGRNS
ncbi:ASKHA domain-containing protein [Desulfosarcina ovata]|uniref:Ferredoxin n=2 Tax=Desulfosarcina ovata TaxID=83564 RepID=A0A5K8AIP2_9BACT|nr:ASKHA domain-containing protein [Desulfosarcina ovata]BBO85518.1 ferredoxin [Desulfosarcina ovata subsp. sediminis]BBO92553.1 ferredoxin [Desulfosarcina ovata subsp. ovata]